MNVIADGNIHKIDDNYAYILYKINNYIEIEKELEVIKEFKQRCLITYIEYLYKFDPRYSKFLMYFALSRDSIEMLNYEFITRTPEMASMVCGFSTLALKFKRVKGDNLDGR